MIWNVLRIGSFIVTILAIVVAVLAATEGKWYLTAFNLVIAGITVFLFGFASAAKDELG